jgi:hypothetical protein
MKRVIAVWMLISVVGCTSMQPVHVYPPGTQQFRHALNRYALPGRDIRITTADGSIHEFRVRSLTHDHVSGTSPDGIEHHVEIATITGLETERINRRRSIALAATGGAILAVLFLLVWANQER